MSKNTTINASGLACPQPVILTKKALQEYDNVTVIVDNMTAVENIKRLAQSMNCTVDIDEGSPGEIELRVTKDDSFNPEADPDNISCSTTSQQTAGPAVFVIATDTMGKGSDELGAILMKAFIHTSTELETIPDVMIFYNAGVKLTAEGSDVLDDLKLLEKKGVKMLVCGTCVNYFGLTGKVAAGVVSNMYDIAGTLSRAVRIIQP